MRKMALSYEKSFMLSYQKHEERARELLNSDMTLTSHLGKNYLEAALDELEALREHYRNTLTG